MNPCTKPPQGWQCPSSHCQPPLGGEESEAWCYCLLESGTPSELPLSLELLAPEQLMTDQRLLGAASFQVATAPYIYFTS